MQRSPDQQLYQKILDLEQQAQEVKCKSYASAFLVHIILKAIPIGLLFFDGILASVFNQKFSTQLIILFIIVEFWWTKNITGKRMLGVRWYFGEDKYGVQRLKFECRANDQYIYGANTKMFWLVQFAYCVLPFIFIIGLILIVRQTLRLDERRIALNVIILMSGIGNIFFFLKVGGGTFLFILGVQQRQSVLKTRLGIDFVRKLGLASITSHY